MKRNLYSIALLLALTIVFAATAPAIQLKFLSVSGGPGSVGPYNLEITGDVAIAGPPALSAFPDGNILGVCNDIAGTVSSGESWTVQKHALFNDPFTDNIGSLEKGKWDTDGGPSTHAKFFETTPLDNFLDAQLLHYKVGAFLANNVLNNLARTDSQHALWGLFQTDYVLTGDQSTLLAVAYLAVAKGWDGWKNFAVYTKVPLLEAPPGGTQEFYVRDGPEITTYTPVPEAASFASLGLYFGSLGLLGFAFRRRMQ